MKSTEQAARVLFDQLPARSKMLVMAWRTRGAGWADAVLNSNVMGSGPTVSPDEAARAKADDDFHEMMFDYQRRMAPTDDASRRRETAEHEAAHFVVAQALNVKVQAAAIAHDGDGGGCFHSDASPFETAVISLAGEMWVGLFRSLEFPRGALGCDADRRAAIAAVGNDMNWELGKAHRRCWEILKENRAHVLAVADQIDRDGNYIPAAPPITIPAARRVRRVGDRWVRGNGDYSDD